MRPVREDSEVKGAHSKPFRRNVIMLTFWISCAVSKKKKKSFKFENLKFR